MTVRHLEIFIKVAECKKMRQAAEELFISQPSVSQAIREIEQQYNVVLFERLSKKLYITDQGERLLKHAYHVVESFKTMEQDIISMGTKQNIRIGGTVSVGACLMPAIMKQYEKENSEVTSSVTIHNITKIQGMLMNSTLDLGIVEGEVAGEELIQVPLCKDHLVLFCNNEHHFAKRESIAIEELQGMDMIMREEGSSARNVFDQILKEHQITMNQKWLSTNTESIKQAVLAGQGVAVLSNLLLREEFKSGIVSIVPIENVTMERAISIVYHKNKFMTEAIKEFIEVAKNVAKEIQ